eukprot:scaffold1435_cov162-Ochromonas_danica.AAC.1
MSLRVSVFRSNTINTKYQIASSRTSKAFFYSVPRTMKFPLRVAAHSIQSKQLTQLVGFILAGSGWTKMKDAEEIRLGCWADDNVALGNLGCDKLGI